MIQVKVYCHTKELLIGLVGLMGINMHMMVSLPKDYTMTHLFKYHQEVTILPYLKKEVTSLSCLDPVQDIGLFC
jgi:hypothetical protein